MSLSSSLYTGVSGLTNFGNSMQVIGDNIANVNTIGFKGNRYTFADLLSQSISTQAGTAQVGRGMSIGDVSATFESGSLESTGNTTDLSIGGDGFFVVREYSTESLFYTRAGNFFFDKDAYLVNPEGFVVQGWQLDETTGEDEGAVTDIQLGSFTSPPRESTEATVITNLNADSNSKTPVISNVWDGLADEDENNIDGANYEYQTVVKVYDSLGSTHDITVYYDKRQGSTWEYMITCNPEEDKRNLVQGTSGMGLLARGTFVFSESSGNISDMTMEKFTGLIGNIQTQGAITNENTIFTIEDYDAIVQDGYGVSPVDNVIRGFSLEYDGSSWSFEDIDGNGAVTANDLPVNYPRAKILSGDANGLKIDLNGDTSNTVDLSIDFQTPATATDSLQFNIISPTDIQVQSVTNTTYEADTANDNTTLNILDPSVLTIDSPGLRIGWDASEQLWYWSNPLLQNVMNTRTTNLTGAASPLTAQVLTNNPGVMTQYSENVTVLFDSSTDTWTFESPYARDLSGLTYANGISENNVTYVVNDPTMLTQRAMGNQVFWDNTIGVINETYDGLVVTAANTTMTMPQEENLTRDNTNPMSISWDGANWTWTSAIDPQYPNRTNTIVGDATYCMLDLTGDGPDIRFDFAAPLVGAPGTITFDIDSSGQWSWSMPAVDVSSFSGEISTFNTRIDINDQSAIDRTTSPVPGNELQLEWDPATLTWSFIGPVDLTTVVTDQGVGFPGALGILGATSDQNQVQLDLNGAGADFTFYFETPLSTNPADPPSTITFNLDQYATAPEQYSSAQILSSSNEDALSIDINGDGTGDIIYTFRAPLSANGTIGFDIDTYIPPFEYPNAVIDPLLSSDSRLVIDLNNDGQNNLDFSFMSGAAITTLTDNGIFEFDIDPRVPPAEYPLAQITGDRDNVGLDMDADGEDDITFTFDDPLPTGAGARDSAINFDIEGSTAWENVQVNDTGYYEFMADFLGGTEGGTEMNIEFNAGTRDDGTGKFVNDSLTTTQYARSSTTTFQSSDGYGAGDLQGVDVDIDGTITGIYSNGELIPLYRVALARFLNNNGLFKEGGNLYRETRDSGAAITNRPGSGGTGSISPNSLEMSNVDVATEFVKMITSQRSYQANSKIVTTVDQMLSDTISMKR